MKAKILESQEVGMPFCDWSPDRTEIVLEGIDCDTEEFISRFLATPEGCHFCWYESSMKISDIGGSSIDLSVGSIIDLDKI